MIVQLVMVAAAVVGVVVIVVRIVTVRIGRRVAVAVVGDGAGVDAAGKWKNKRHY